GRSAMIFQHLPPFESTVDDTAFTTAAVPHAPRLRLLETFIRHNVAVIACGHLHVYRQLHYHGMRIVWAPATSFFNIIEKQRRGLVVPRAGYIEAPLNGPHITHRLADPPLMIPHDVGAWNAAQGSTTKLPARPLSRP